MEVVREVAHLVEVIAWPGLAVFVVLLMRPHIKRLIDGRDVTIKVGNLELTSQQAVNAFNSQIQDIMTRIINLENAIGYTTVEEGSQPNNASERSRVLWVDDNPENNALVVDTLLKKGLSVEIARSTSEAVDILANRSFDIVISDMHRIEDGQENKRAGIDLLERIRDHTAKKIVYAGAYSIKRFGPDAKNLGAAVVTTSPTEVLRAVGKVN